MLSKVRIINFLKKIQVSQRALYAWTLHHTHPYIETEAHLAEDGFVGFREELGQLFRVTQVQRQSVHTQTLGVQVLLLAQLVDIHPLHHQ